jgi:hypothetical protein
MLRPSTQAAASLRAENSSTSTAPPGEARAARSCFARLPAAILIPRRLVYGDGKGVGESTETLSWHPRVVEPPGRGRVVSVPQVGGLHYRYARGVGRQGCMAEPGAMPGPGSVCAGQEKTPPILPFITPKKSTQRPRVCRRDAPSIDERFCHRIRPGDDVFGTHRTTTPLSRASSSPLGGEEWRPFPKSAVYIIATRAWRRQAMVHGKAWRHAGHRERLRPARKSASPPPIYHPDGKGSARPPVCRREAPTIDERFCRRIRPDDDVFGSSTVTVLQTIIWQ